MRSERWSAPAEIKRNLYRTAGTCDKGGPVLYWDKGSKYVYDGEAHSLILGMSGAGKTRGCILPMIRNFIEAEESFIVLDPKKEIYRNTHYLIGDQYETWVIDFRDLRRSKGWNPLWLLYKLYTSENEDDKLVATEKIQELAQAIFPDDMDDRFWVSSSRAMFQGVVHGLFECAGEEEINISSVYKMVAEGDEKIGRSINCFQEWVRTLSKDSAASMLLNNYAANSASQTRASMRCVFLDGFSSMIISDGLRDFLGQNDLDICRLDGTKPLALYIVLPDENAVYENLAGVLISQLMTHFVRLAHDKYNGRLPKRLNICLEELGNIGKSIPKLDHMMSAGRSRNIRLHLVLQSLSQLDDIYGASKAVTITSNADVVIAFRTNHLGTLEQLSKLVGERENLIEHQIFKEALITPAQLGAMDTRQVLVMVSGRMKYITKIPDYEEMFDCRDWKVPEKSPVCQRKKIQVFSIMDYLRKRNAEKGARKEETVKKSL